MSIPRNNDEMVNALVRGKNIQSKFVEAAFRAVDKGNYHLPDSRENAYNLSAWRYGKYHLSAPNIYALVVQHLDLKPGHSFLNVGSGTGYLSTVVGLFLGPSGTNHGVELYSELVNFSRARFAEFKKSRDNVNFPEAIFDVGNCFTINREASYDRVYCGGGCPSTRVMFMKKLVKIGGLIVMPVENQLQKIVRKSETTWETMVICGVIFKPLEEPRFDDVPVDAAKPKTERLGLLARKETHDILQCSICLETYTNPKALPCQHTFCLGCLNDVVGTNVRINCPNCREVHDVPKTGAAGFKDNLIVNDLLELMHNSSPCTDCKKIVSTSQCEHCGHSVCIECRTSHNRLQIEIFSMLKYLNKDLRKAHPDPVECHQFWQKKLDETKEEQTKLVNAFDEAIDVLNRRKTSLQNRLKSIADCQSSLTEQNADALLKKIDSTVKNTKTTVCLEEVKETLSEISEVLESLSESATLKFVSDLAELNRFGKIVLDSSDGCLNVSENWRLSEHEQNARKRHVSENEVEDIYG